MKQKLTLLLLALFTTMGAWAEPDVTGKTFTLQCIRGYVFYNGSVLAGTSEAANASKFAIVSYDSNTYLYDATNKAFVCHTTAAKAGSNGNPALENKACLKNVVKGLKWGNTEIPNYPYYLEDSYGNWLNMDGNPKVYFNTWKNFEGGNGGNTYAVAVVDESFDATEATNILKNYFETQSILNEIGVYALQSEYGVNDAGKISTNSSDSDEGNLPALLDNNYGTYHHSDWHGNATTPHWITFEVADVTDAIRFYIKQRSTGTGRPTEIVVSASNDNSTFTEIATVNPSWDGNPLDTYSDVISASNSYKYWRFTVTKTNSTENGWFCASEWYVLPNNDAVDAFFSATLALRNMSSTPEEINTAHTNANAISELMNTKTITYTLTDENGSTYTGTYSTTWHGDETLEPTIPGASGATLNNKVFSSESGNYTLTADITFEFPVSSNGTNKPTAIMSALGESLWYAKDDKVIADNKANTIVYDIYADNYRWYIKPVFSEGTFAFKLYNVGAAKYIPSNPSTSYNTATTLTDNEGNAGAFQYSHYSQGNGFYDTAFSKFLTINSSGKAQNIWLWAWNGSSTHRGSVMSFPTTLEVTSVADAFAALKNTTKFDILEGSTVMGPSEFAAPTEINAAIDVAQNIGEDDAEAMIGFIEGENGQKIQNYLNQVATYGNLANVQITMKREYGTMILPCPCTRIDGLDIYSCSGAEGNVLTLTPVTGNYSYYKPYIIQAEVGSKYTIIGWDKGGTDTYTDGWLTGSLNDGTEIPDGSYMLATNKSTNVQAFYQVSGTGVPCAKYKCYLTVPSGEAKTFFFDGDQATAIEELFGSEVQDGTIYNLAGQRISKMQKGINIVNGKKVMVK